jgi:hypothetical protein
MSAVKKKCWHQLEKIHFHNSYMVSFKVKHLFHKRTFIFKKTPEMSAILGMFFSSVFFRYHMYSFVLNDKKIIEKAMQTDYRSSFVHNLKR